MTKGLCFAQKPGKQVHQSIAHNNTSTTCKIAENVKYTGICFCQQVGTFGLEPGLKLWS